jgi:hypothetical protein
LGLGAAGSACFPGGTGGAFLGVMGTGSFKVLPGPPSKRCPSYTPLPPGPWPATPLASCMALPPCGWAFGFCWASLG